MVSTKGVFLGLGAVMLLLQAGLSPEFAFFHFFASVVVWAAGAIFLSTNPKE